MNNFVFALAFSLILLTEVTLFAQGTSFDEFRASEQNNSYTARDTSVGEKYLPGTHMVFDLPVFSINPSLVSVFDSGLNSYLSEHYIHDMRDPERIQFYVHPESTEFFSPLLQGTQPEDKTTLQASSSSSIRTVMIKDDHEDAFIKLSLAKHHDRVFRVLPAYQIRQGVAISKLIVNSNYADWIQHGVGIIPEVAGVYTNLVTHTVENKTEFGYVVRDPHFLKEYSKDTVIPLFGLFQQGEDGLPLIIKLWKESGTSSFYKFVEDFLIQPYTEAIGYMSFYQGIFHKYPHSQNIVIVMDSITKKIKQILFRDLSSMKVDVRIRMANQLSISDINYENSLADFNMDNVLERGFNFQIEYFIDMGFGIDYKRFLHKHVPNYNPEILSEIFKIYMNRQVAKYFPEAKVSEDVYSTLKSAIESLDVKNIEITKRTFSADITTKALRTLKSKRAVLLPRSWISHFSDTFTQTDYGVVFKRSAVQKKFMDRFIFKEDLYLIPFEGLESEIQDYHNSQRPDHSHERSLELRSVKTCGRFFNR